MDKRRGAQTGTYVLRRRRSSGGYRDARSGIGALPLIRVLNRRFVALPAERHADVSHSKIRLANLWDTLILASPHDQPIASLPEMTA